MELVNRKIIVHAARSHWISRVIGVISNTTTVVYGLICCWFRSFGETAEMIMFPLISNSESSYINKFQVY